jgi:Domain of unknown function (DUF4911)
MGRIVGIVCQMPQGTQKSVIVTDVEATLRRYRVPLPAIAYVRMIVEAYEGLAVMVSTRGSTLIEWHVAPGREDEADTLARALGDEVALRPA